MPYKNFLKEDLDMVKVYIKHHHGNRIQNNNKISSHINETGTLQKEQKQPVLVETWVKWNFHPLLVSEFYLV